MKDDLPTMRAKTLFAALFALTASSSAFAIHSAKLSCVVTKAPLVNILRLEEQAPVIFDLEWWDFKLRTRGAIKIGKLSPVAMSVYGEGNQFNLHMKLQTLDINTTSVTLVLDYSLFGAFLGEKLKARIYGYSAPHPAIGDLNCEVIGRGSY